MKKKIKLFLLIIITITLISVDNMDVFAVDASISVTPTGSSGTNSCNWAGNCYSMGTGGVRITLLDGNANKVKNTIDLWYYGKSLSFYDNNSAALVYYNKKYLRQDLAKMKHKDVYNAIKLNSTSEYTFKSIEDVLPNILGKGDDLDYNGHKFSSGYGNVDASSTGYLSNEYDWAYAKQNNRVPNMTEKIMNRIYTNIKSETKYGGSKQSKQLYLKKLLSAMGTSIDNIDDSYTLQFEPLVNWENGKLNNGTNAAKFTSFNFLGTISELYVLYYNYSSSFNSPEKFRISKKFCRKSNTTNYCYSGDFAPFNNNNIPKPNFQKIVDGSGIYVNNSGKDGNVIPTDSKNNAIFKTTSSGNSDDVNDLGSKLNVAYGVGFISLSKLIDSFGCVKVVDANGQKKDSSGNVIGVKASNYKKVDDYGAAVNKYLKNKKVTTYSWLSEASKYGFTKSTDLKNFIKNNNSCETPSCGKTYEIYRDNKVSKKDFIDKVLDPADSSKRLFGDTYTKGTKEEWNLLIKQAIDNNVVNDYITYGIKNNNVCNASSCEDTLKYIRNIKGNSIFTKKYSKLNNTEKKLVNAFHIAFPKQDYMNPDIIGADALDEIPQCDKTAPKCDVNAVSECKNPYSIIVGKDATSSSNYKKCILSDYLFTNYKGTVKKKNSTRSEYNGVLNDSTNYSIYCSEYVKINMPKEGSDITKAGRVFQWGTNISQSSNKGLDTDTKTYASMVVKQQCFKGPKKANGTSEKFDSKELARFKNINLDRYTTKIKLSYTDPTKTFSYKDLELNTRFIESGSKGMSIYNNQSMVTLYSIYNIEYGKSLTWYSHKGVSEKDMINKTKYDSLSSDFKKNEYIFIGYGAPTSFNTADGTYKESISAKVTKIGYKGQYDSLFSNSVAEYKCDFRIHNEIIGNECCDAKTGKPFPGAPSYCTCDGGDGPKGIDVAFRTIELVNKNVSKSSYTSEINKAFPGRSGAGRYTNNNIGKNWATIIQSDTTKVMKILRNTIYNETPQYTISLDAGTITKIRNSNQALRNAGVDPYTYLGPKKKDTGYTCYDDEGKNKFKYCRSHFVDTYIKKGKCMQNRSGAEAKKPCGQ